MEHQARTRVGDLREDFLRVADNDPKFGYASDSRLDNHLAPSNRFALRCLQKSRGGVGSRADGFKREPIIGGVRALQLVAVHMAVGRDDYSASDVTQLRNVAGTEARSPTT